MKYWNFKLLVVCFLSLIILSKSNVYATEIKKDIKTKINVIERLRYESFIYPLFDYNNNLTHKRYTTSRLRISIDEKIDKDLSLKLNFQSLNYIFRKPENDASISKNDFITYELYFNFKKFLSIDHLQALVGRQELVFGNARILGNGNWGEGRSWDGIRLIYKPHNYELNILNFELRRNNTAPLVQIYGIYYYNKHQKDNLELYTLKCINHNLVPSELNRLALDKINVNTFGINYTYKFNKKFEGNIETAFQNGKYGIDDHKALAFHGEIKYNPFQKYTLILEHNFAHGDKDPTDGKHETFYNLFPTNHQKYGFMDLVSWQNMKEFAIRNIFDIRNDLRTCINYHIFKLYDSHDAWYAANQRVFNNRRDITGQSGDDLGSELDFVVIKKFKNNLELETGICKFFAGDFVKNTTPINGNVTDATWGYVQVLKRW